MREPSTPTGRLTIRLVDPRTGAIELERRVHNLVTLAGRQLLADLFRGEGVIDAETDIEIVAAGPQDGAPTNPAALGDTALQYTPLAATADVVSSQVQDVDGEPRIVTTLMATFDADLTAGDQVLTEAGVQLSPGGVPTLYSRVVFGAITKTATLQMTLSWEVIF